MDDLISRQAVNTLVDELARAISDERCFLSRGRSTGEIMSDILNLPSVESKRFDGMTNREVIQALFPQIELVEIYNGRHRFFLKGKESSAFDLKAEVKWLNAPYQKGGE